MNLASAINGRKEGEPIILGKTPYSTLQLENHEGKWIPVKRQSSLITSDAFAKAMLSKEFEVGTHASGDGFLAYRETFDENTAFVMERGCMSLELLVSDKPSILSDAKSVGAIVDEMLDALAHMHEKDICMVALTPESLLLTKDTNQIRIFAPFSFYKDLGTKLLGEEKNEFIAPECYGENGEFSVLSDVYSAGKMIDYLYSFTHLPRALRSVVKKATAEDPDDRYGSIEELKKAIRRSNSARSARNVVLLVAAVLAVALYIFLDSNSDSTPVDFVKPANNSHKTIESGIDDNALSGVDPGNDSIGNDTIAMTAESEYQKKAEEIFRKEFARRANPVLSKVYNKANLSGGESEFRTASTTSMIKLQKIQEQLSDQYKLSHATAEKIASDVINELASQKMNELK